MKRNRQFCGSTPIKCNIKGANIGRGRFSTKNATFDSLNGEVGYVTLTENGIEGSALWTVWAVIGGIALWMLMRVNLANYQWQ